MNIAYHEQVKHIYAWYNTTLHQFLLAEFIHAFVLLVLLLRDIGQ